MSTGEPQLRLRIIGAGRAGRSIGMALEGAGCALAGYLGRNDDPREAAAGVDLLLIATPDAAIAGVAEVLKGRLRAEDAIFRYGGDEFCCILPDADRAAAGRIVEDALIAARERGGSFSVGLAQLSAADDRASLLARADTELYRGRAARGYHGRA